MEESSPRVGTNGNGHGSPPVARFSASPTGGMAPLKVTFDGAASSPRNKIVDYGWNFGDGQYDDGDIVTHTYSRPGGYEVILGVTDVNDNYGEARRFIEVTNAPPIAKITATPTTGIAPLKVAFDASGSYDPDGTISSYTWNFGDGQSGSGPNPPPHTYTSSGPYAVAIAVTDDGGDVGTAGMTITVYSPLTALFTTTPTTGPTPLTVAFDASGSTDPNPGGVITDYGWDFGDGQAGTGKTTTHIYTNSDPGGHPQTFNPTLKITDNFILTNTYSMLITVDPRQHLTAAFTATPTTGIAPLTVAFDASGSSDPNPGGVITGYGWGFGDGQAGTGETTTHIYTTLGQYTVTLSIIDDGGAKGSIQETITAEEPPTASFTYTADPLRGSLTVDFDASGSSDPNPGGKITSYSWDFGDGQTSSAASTYHTYTAAGSYTVKLTVTDNFNLQGSSTQTISVPLQTVPSS